MGSLAQPDRGPRRGILEAADTIHPRPGGIDDRTGLDRDGLAVDLDLGTGDPAAEGSERDDLGAVEDDRAVVRRRPQVGEREAGVVRPGIRVQRARTQALDAEARNLLARSLRSDEPVQPGLGQRRVEEDPALHDPGAIGTATVEREQERQAADEVGSDHPRQQPALVVRLADEPDVTETQVAQTTVDQLGGRTRRAAAEIAGVDERHREPGARSVRRRGGADDAAADDEEVEPARRELVERLPAGQTANGVRPRLPSGCVGDLDADVPGGRRQLEPRPHEKPLAVGRKHATAWTYPSRPALTAAPIDLPETRVIERQGLQATSTAPPSRATSCRTGPADE